MVGESNSGLGIVRIVISIALTVGAGSLQEASSGIGTIVEHEEVRAMGFKKAGDFIQMLVDKGVLPEDTIRAEIILNWHDVPIIRCERMPDGDLVEMIILSIGETDQLIPPPPKPEPATER